MNLAKMKVCGLHPPWAQEILKTNPAFAKVFQELETQFYINNMWVTPYSPEARGPLSGPSVIF
jgi:hypothetical protein